MAPRTSLQTLFEGLLGSKAVYFQPPSSVQMQYPCIVYKRNDHTTNFADNLPYRTETQYEVTVMDRDPDSPIPDRVLALPRCRFDRHFTADNLNHDVFTLYF